MFADVRERRGERNAEPVDELLRWQPHPCEIVDHGRFEIVGAPANTWVIRAGIVVRTAVIDVVVGAARAQRPTNALARDRLPAARAAEQTAREREIGIAGPAVLGIQNALARIERGPVDEPLVAALVDAAVATKLADVEPVVEDVRKRRAVEARLAGAEDVTFSRELVGQRLERLLTRRIELEDTDDRPALLRVRLNRLVGVVHVDVAVRCEARGPALAHLLVHSLEHFRPQIVAVVLCDGGHHVERKRSGGSRAELVFDKRELDAAVVLEFLEAHRVAHVAAHAVEFVAEDGRDLLAFGVGPHPVEHLVERHALRPALGRLGHGELAQDRPA